ncbi:MAG: hypothetical protein CO113_01235 [Elusimicrobia bacterium CG_4_9_14_3_um_filter_62_55]|nr:MAG: hypothetical protein COR54_14720 [Elusimicrobia bacterium CG22_combo_CG10-13_8_21_14_all_63_91]PJA16358.1 MAG: hypothetical protein COX66_07780 [Elusimicrobia bacterium CG_4_10_14_0_2_um_filter_63_34]PJB26895.1 MAG: hypothetical protein CO113_01235 [Elusimicrobia bacterium CG_4_9_14_3_um_filter_62_55]
MKPLWVFSPRVSGPEHPCRGNHPASDYGLKTMKMKKTPLAFNAALSPFVRYCNVKTISIKHGETVRNKTQADPWPSMVVSLGSPVHRIRGGRTGPALPKVAVFGVAEGPDEIEMRPGHSHLTISFNPGRAHPFFGTTLKEFSDREFSLGDVWGREGREIEERIAHTGSSAAVKSILESALLKRLPLESGYPAGVLEAMRAALRHGGKVSVNEMAQTAGMSAVHLKRLFTQWVGMAPKIFCRIIRFQSLCASLSSQRKPEWAGLSYESGYAHQSHMIRDFLAFSGETPSSFYDSVVVPSAGPGSPLKAFQPDPTFHA